MNVIIIDESEKKSWIKTRRIISKYLKRSGNRTWLGNISQIGLNNLYNELKAVATKSTSVICHKVISRKTISISWIVGNKNNFDINGEYAFRYKKRKEKSIEENKNESFIKEILAISSLCHDFGKGSKSFQNKLRTKTPSSELFRHEIISALIFLELLQIKKFDKKTLSVLNMNEFYQDEFSDALLENITQESIKNTAISFSYNLTLYFNILNDVFYKLEVYEKAPKISNILWLIMTHHKLPFIDDDNIEIILKRKQYISSENILNYGIPDNNLQKSYIKHYQNKNAKNEFTFEYDMPWHDNDWLSKFNKSLISIIDFKDEHLLKNLYKISSSILRPLLIYSDVAASKAKIGSLCDKSVNYANTTIDASDNTKSILADTLDEHLKKTYKFSKSFFNILHNQSFWLSSLSRQEILSNDDNKLNQISNIEKYKWQDESDNLTKNINLNESSGFIGFVISQTGAGKTLGSLKIAKNFSEDLRLTYLIGYRSLVTQTSDKLKTLFHKNDITTLVGNTEILNAQKALYQENEFANQNEHDDDTFNYSFDLISEESDSAKEFNLKNRFKFDEKTNKIINSPVLVGTIDFFIPTVHGNRSNDTKLFLRIATSDIILDEIDSYSPQDLIAVGKLVYLTGLLGRKVIIMSATSTPEIFQGFIAAYESGYKIHRQIKNQTNNFYYGIYSDKTEPILLEYKSLNESLDVYFNYINNYIEKLYISEKFISSKFLPSKNGILALGKEKDKNKTIENYEEIIKQSDEFHNEFKIKVQDCHISIGFVRFNNVKSCQNFCKHIETSSDTLKTYTKIVCYHSDFPPIARIYLDMELDKLSNRTDIKKWENRVLKIMETTDKKELKIIVVCTSIIETGRDHDYDWCILEAHSNRSLVQSTGRILRHRDKDHKRRIAILGYTFNTELWKFSGINDKIFNIKKYEGVIENSFEPETINGINAKTLLLNTSITDNYNYISYFEHELHNTVLNYKNGFSLNSFLQSTQLHNLEINALHHHFYKFREKSGTDLELSLIINKNMVNEDDLAFFDKNLIKWRSLKDIGNNMINFELKEETKDCYLFNINTLDIIKKIENNLNTKIYKGHSLIILKLKRYDPGKRIKLIYDTNKGIYQLK